MLKETKLDKFPTRLPVGYKRAHSTTQTLNTFMNYSDKIHSCTSFFAVLGRLVVEKGSLFEGKWLHDREGGVIKGASNKRMTKPGAIVWDLNKTWSSSLISY